MGEGFKKQKTRHMISVLVKSAVCGLSFGLFSACTVLLALKLSALYLATIYYVIIGAGAALLCGGIMFFIFKLGDKKLAKELDKKYGLDERAQTAIEFAEGSGAVVEMQRLDTEKRLSALPRVEFNFKNFWQFILITFLAIAICVTAVIVPAKQVEGGADGGQTETDAPFSVSEEQLAGLNEIIENVNSSALKTTVKKSVVTLLNRLVEKLATAELVSQMQSMVNDTVTKTETLISNEYSYIKIANALAEFNQYPFAAIIADGVRVYRDYKLEDYSEVQRFASESSDKVAEATEEGLAEIFKTLAEDSGNTSAEIYTSLLSSKIYEGDGLYTVLFNFAKGLAKDGLTGSIRLALTLGLRDELAAQAYTRAVKCYVITNLGILFDVKVPDDADFVPKNGSSEDKEDDKTNNGGYGDGSWKLDYQIYNPNTGEYENYMDILEAYFAIVDSMLRTPGQFTEEQINIIRTYFEILFSGDQQ